MFCFIILLTLPSIVFATTVEITDVLEDFEINHFNNLYEESYRVLIKFGLNIPEGNKITEAELFLYRHNENGWNNNLNIYRIDNQEWTEYHDINYIWNMIEQRTHLQELDDKWTVKGWDSIDVLDAIIEDYNNNNNISFWLEDPDFNDTVPNYKGNHLLGVSFLYIGTVSTTNNYTSFSSSEHTNEATRPYLKVTYFELLNWSTPNSLTPETYSSTSSQFNITWTDQDDIGTVLIEIKNSEGNVIIDNQTMSSIEGDIYNYFVSLPAGDFSWKSYASDVFDNWKVSDSWNFTIKKATPQLNLSCIDVEYPTNASCMASESNINDFDLLYSLFVGDNLIDSGSLIEYNELLSAGAYDVIYNTSDGQNYTSDFEQITLTVTEPVTTTTTPPAPQVLSGGFLIIQETEQVEEVEKVVETTIPEQENIPQEPVGSGEDTTKTETENVEQLIETQPVPPEPPSGLFGLGIGDITILGTAFALFLMVIAFSYITKSTKEEIRF